MQCFSIVTYTSPTYCKTGFDCDSLKWDEAEGYVNANSRV